MQEKIIVFIACFVCLLTGYAASSVLDMPTLFSGKEVLLSAEQKISLLVLVCLFFVCLSLVFALMERLVIESKIETAKQFLNLPQT